MFTTRQGLVYPVYLAKRRSEWRVSSSNMTVSGWVRQIIAVLAVIYLATSSNSKGDASASGRLHTQGVVNLIALGDGAGDTPERAKVAATMNRYSAESTEPIDGAVFLGDIFGMKLTGQDDPAIGKLFEKAYDLKRMPFPFYCALGNHDYEYGKQPMELGYAASHPESRFKMPSSYYRIDLPQDHPVLTLLMLDSNKQAMSERLWADQTKWIESELSKPRGTWTVCCAHHTMFSNGAHGDNGVLQTSWGEIFKNQHVDFYLCGHDHTMQHLEIADWPMSFVISGGAGGGRRQMLRDNRGPFSKSTLGFAHLRFDAESVTVQLMDENGDVIHAFTRDRQGRVQTISNTASDPATKHPLRVIQGVDGQPAGVK
jgi:hypothetical protein